MQAFLWEAHELGHAGVHGSHSSLDSSLLPEFAPDLQFLGSFHFNSAASGFRF